MNVEELPQILSSEEEAELQLTLQGVQAGESQDYMLAKYMIARVFVHDRVDLQWVYILPAIQNYCQSENV